jgi:hypothetical protein
MDESTSERYLREILEQLRSQESRYEQYLTKTRDLYEGHRRDAQKSTWSNFIFCITIVAIGVFVGGFMLKSIQ